MKLKLLLITLITAYVVPATAQEDPASLPEKIDQLTYKWDTEAVKLKTYEGLSGFCKNVSYRQETIQLLNDIHHYDSLLYDRLKTLSRRSSNKEISKTLKEIEKFEQEYSMKKFIHFLHGECTAQKELEHDSKDRRNDLGMESYDSQVILIEAELKKYVKHITKRADQIREHVHHLKGS
ncbi:MAG: hypothetical protein KI790_09335 [Cyclobacteriaceae bacterium]|nr:hypothetical protein [Cyclobacteriaceae bacterium HetDA_MAG_MS6]